MRTAYTIVNSTGRTHPFQNGIAGRAWFDGFMLRHPNLTLGTTQPLSYRWAAAACQENVADFLATLGAICACLNLLIKPMIFNVDETGISIINLVKLYLKKVVTEVGRRSVWSVRGKIHTVVTCVSASGFCIPPMMIYPRKRMTEKLQCGAVPAWHPI